MDAVPEARLFWKSKTLAEMSPAEWESLCDRCGKCCLVVLEDVDSGAFHETDVACRLYDPKTRRCTDYGRRHARVPDCVRLSPDAVGALKWMPKTCAYRLISEGRDLPDWHPLLTGDPGSVARAGAAASADVASELDVPLDDLQRRVTGRR